MYLLDMDFETKERLAMRGRHDNEALGRRLKAARICAGLSQRDLAEAVGRVPTAIINMEKGRSAVTIRVMSYLYKAHRIDMNFLILGEFTHLPGHVQGNLFRSLASLDHD